MTSGGKWEEEGEGDAAEAERLRRFLGRSVWLDWGCDILGLSVWLFGWLVLLWVGRWDG